MDTLARLCLADNTLLIFTSDNGPLSIGKGHSSAWKWRGQKSNIWEGGHRVPFVVRWPARIRPGTVSDEPIELTDLIATCAAILGTKLPEEAGPDSYNILAALIDEKRNKTIREAIVSHSVYGVFAIRQGDWKLILETKTSGGYPGGTAPKPGAPGQLYNLADDPYEKNDLWEKHPEVIKHLTELLAKYKKQGRSAKSP